MKTFNKIFLFGLAVLFAWGCEKEEERAILSTGAAPVVTLSTKSVVLNKDNATKEALTISWAADYGFSAAATNTILIDKKGGNFSKASSITAGSDLKKTFTTAELNGILLGLGLAPGTPADIEIKITATMGAATVLSSTVNSLTATPYLDKLDLSSTWGVVGSATTNGWDDPDMPFYKTEVPNVFVAYVKLKDGEIKVRENNNWAVNYGGTNGVLKKDGDNIAVKAGTYKITFNPVALTYKVEKYSWGIVGSAFNNWGATPDAPLNYDPSVDLWAGVVTLIDGDIKIRKDNDWGVNYGGSNGTLKENGDNIAVKKGTYLITVDFKTMKYTITKYAPWGIVGDATATGWGEKPDQKFSYDLSTETWYLNNVVLKDGQIKFRLNDDWGVNYGSANSVEPDPIAASGALKDGGKNFGVKAGTWNFVLNVKDPAKPTYKATKVK